MKYKRVILISTIISMSLNSCLFNRASDYMGKQEYSASVEDTNSGYSKIENPLTYSKYKNYSAYPTFTPNEGEVNLLAIPVLFTDSKINTQTRIQEVKNDINKSLFGNASDTGWESVSSYYSKSSFGKLTIKGTVSDPYQYQGTSTKFASDAKGLESSDVGRAVVSLLDDAVKWYKANNPSEDMTKYDLDKDGYLDGVYLIYLNDYYGRGQTEESFKLDPDVFWAFCSWTNIDKNTTSPTPGVFFWCSYYFLFEGYGDSKLDSHTFIHETGHMLGLDDYYSYNTIKSGRNYITPSPLGGVDMMDLNIIDHNAFSKFSLGWVKPYVIDKEGSLTIKKSSTTGECVIIPTGSYNRSSFDEYLMIELYSPDNLNDSDINKGYSPRDIFLNQYGKLDSVGIRVYHVDARLVSYKDIAESALDEKYFTDLGSLNKLDKDNFVIVGHSNTPEGQDKDGKLESYNIALNPSYRLIQAITPEGVDYQSNEKYVSNNSLFYKGGHIKLTNSRFRKQFPNGQKENMANNGFNLLFNFTVDDMSKDSCKLTFTSIK